MNFSPAEIKGQVYPFFWGLLGTRVKSLHRVLSRSG